MRLSKYDKARLRKWADMLAMEHKNRGGNIGNFGENVNPYLLAALEQFLSAPDAPMSIDMARAAIAKAKGE